MFIICHQADTTYVFLYGGVKKRGILFCSKQKLLRTVFSVRAVADSRPMTKFKKGSDGILPLVDDRYSPTNWVMLQHLLSRLHYYNVASSWHSNRLRECFKVMPKSHRLPADFIITIIFIVVVNLGKNLLRVPPIANANVNNWK